MSEFGPVLLLLGVVVGLVAIGLVAVGYALSALVAVRRPAVDVLSRARVSPSIAATKRGAHGGDPLRWIAPAFRPADPRTPGPSSVGEQQHQPP